MVACSEVSEAAVVGFPHELKGEGIGCYVILKDGVEGSASLTTKLKSAVRSAIGAIATPDFIIYTDLPKTRSGKIMRRILRKVAAGEADSIGDVSTLADPSVSNYLAESKTYFIHVSLIFCFLGCAQACRKVHSSDVQPITILPAAKKAVQKPGLLKRKKKMTHGWVRAFELD